MPLSPPFAEYGCDAARRYDAWYASPAGRVMAAEEQALLSRLIGTTAGHRSVLEVGCGTGSFTRWFAGQGLTAVGVDSAPAMLAVAQERRGAAQYVWATAEALPFADDSVDLVAFITSLEFLDRPTFALREAGRVARHGLVLGVLNLASPRGLRRTLLAPLRPSSPYRAAHFPTPGRLERAVRRSLGARVRDIRWQTAIWPRWLPAWARPRSCGAFIGMLVVLHQSEEGS